MEKYRGFPSVLLEISIKARVARLNGMLRGNNKSRSIGIEFIKNCPGNDHLPSTMFKNGEDFSLKQKGGELLARLNTHTSIYFTEQSHPPTARYILIRVVRGSIAKGPAGGMHEVQI